MNPTYYLLFAFSLTVLSAVHAEKSDNRNFAIDTCYPTPNEIRLAEERARNYWTKNAARYGSNPGLSRGRDLEDFPGRGPRPFAETNKLRDDGQLLFSRNCC